MVDTEPLIAPAPLAGLRVVEIAGGIPAAYCARMLRGFGADTIRLESPAVSRPGGDSGPAGIDGL
ncbi:MAG: CoA transferase, partial [Acidimicrobiales bacterium]